MTRDMAEQVAAAERRNIRASILIAVAFLCVIMTLSTANPLLTLLIEAGCWLGFFLLRPALAGVRHLPYFFVLSQHVYRTTEPQDRISRADRREMRQLLRRMQAGAERQ